MSRSDYSDDIDNWDLIRWRGAVASALRGKRGRAFLQELLAALDALPNKRLVENELEADGEVCALGAVGKARAMDMAAIDPEDNETVAKAFGIAHAMACEIMWLNDEGAWKETPEARHARVHAWVKTHLKGQPPP